MTWETVANLIVAIGLPAAETIVQKWESGAVPSSADFATLKIQAQQTSTDRMKAMLAAAGIPLTDPHAVALLALTQ